MNQPVNAAKMGAAGFRFVTMRGIRKPAVTYRNGYIGRIRRNPSCDWQIRLKKKDGTGNQKGYHLISGKRIQGGESCKPVRRNLFRFELVVLLSCFEAGKEGIGQQAGKN